MSPSAVDPKLALEVLISSGKILPADLNGIGLALDDALNEGHDSIVKLVNAAARIWNLRRGYLPLYVVVDDYLEHQRAYFANIDDLQTYLKRCRPEWNARVAGFAWVRPNQVKEYIESTPTRPFARDIEGSISCP